MKIKNIFKKEKKAIKTSDIQKMDKKQLEKVIGGTDTEVKLSSSTSTAAHEAAHVVQQ